MSNLRPFQIITLAVFAVLAVIGVILLSGFSPSGDEEAKRYGDSVVIWGVLDEKAVKSVISEIENGDTGFEVVSYFQIDLRTFNETLVNAIAEGNSPDLVLMPSSELVRHRSKLLALSYDSVPLRSFKDAYVDGAEIFAREDGVYALPLAVDPIVMYWNRDLFASNGLAQAPTTWEYIVNTVVPSITRRDNNRNILQSALAFGEVQNVLNAKEVILLLAMQSGSKLVYEERGQYVVELNKSISNGLPPFESSVQFFTNFSDSSNQLYSWNRSQQLDRNAFLAGDLGLYFGYGSEAAGLLGQNPNLNFDMALVPQGASATIRRTYGEFYGFAIPKASRNAQGAFLVANRLTRADASLAIARNLGMASAQRSVLAAGSGGSFEQVVFNSALVARSWLDPHANETDIIFKDMIEDITSGRKSLSESNRDSELKIQLAF